MFLPIFIDSINDKSFLPVGEYQVTCTIYRSLKNKCFAQLYAYKSCSTDETLAHDLVIGDGEQNQYFIDFVRLPDQLWRDSYGLKSESFASLLPVEILQYSKTNEYCAGSVKVENY